MNKGNQIYQRFLIFKTFIDFENEVSMKNAKDRDMQRGRKTEEV